MPYHSDHSLADLFDPTPLRRSAERIAERVAEALEREARRRTPVGHPQPGQSLQEYVASRHGRVPGTMKESWKHTGAERGLSAGGTEQFVSEAYTEDPEAPHVEWDTRPHVIRPRADRGPATVVATGDPRATGEAARLRFYAGGRIVYAKEVHHPGTQGKHMMRDALAEIDATWADTIGAEELERWAREQARLIG